MAILNAQVIASPDDGDWNAGTFNNATVSMRAGNLAGNANHSFARFDNLTFDGTITNAYVSIRASSNQSNTVAIRIRGEKAADPNAPSSIADANARVLTTAFVDWSPGVWVSGTYYDTPDLSAIIQELIDDGNIYNGTQALIIYLRDNGSAANANRVFRTYDHDAALSPPLLHIEYTPSNTPPTIAQNTADSHVFSTDTPTLQFTGSDVESNDLTYQIQISDRDSFIGSGSLVTASYAPGAPVGIVHPNPSANLTWQGVLQVDDRPGQSFQAVGNGILDKARVQIGEDLLTDGNIIVRIYDHQGVYGTSSEPLNPATPANTPTPDWLAESDPFPFDTSGPPGREWRELTFSGADRIRLENGHYYMVIVDWIPVTSDYDNTIQVQVDSGLGASGNAYIDGESVANNGVNLTFDLVFEVYEIVTLLDKVSDTDPGFINTVDPFNTDPFTAGEMISYAVQGGETLDESVIYYWRVRCIDPLGSNVWSSWSATREFTISLTPSVEGTSYSKLSSGIMISI